MARRLGRAPLLAAALLTMVWSAWLGLVRLGWPLPVPSADHVLLHGPLFVGGFFGTLIALERAVALGSPWAYAGPILTVAGAALLVAGHAAPAALATTGGSAVLVIASAAILCRQPSLVALTMGAGAVRVARRQRAVAHRGARAPSCTGGSAFWCSRLPASGSSSTAC